MTRKPSALNRLQVERFNRLGRFFQRAQEALTARSNNRETALLALRLARKELDEVITLLEGR